MDSHLVEWLKANEGRFFESPRKKAFGRNPNGFTITSVDLDNKLVTVTFEGSQDPALPLKFSMFERVLEYMEASPHTVYPIGARPRPPYTRESIEGEIWRTPILHPTEYRASPQILDILSLSGLVKYAYTNDRDTGRRVQGAQHWLGLSSLHPPPETEKERYQKKYGKSVRKWTEENRDEIIWHRLGYSWKNLGRKECERLRNRISKHINMSRIKNGGALDLETLDQVTKWGSDRLYPVRDPGRALEVTGKAFELLDMGDLKGAAMALLREKGMRISRATNIIGLSDQENLCIYDNRVGNALRTLTYDMERLVKIPPSRKRQGDSGVTRMEWATNYEHLVWIIEIIRDHMNKAGCTYRTADVEMALFKMGRLPQGNIKPINTEPTQTHSGTTNEQVSTRAQRAPRHPRGSDNHRHDTVGLPRPAPVGHLAHHRRDTGVGHPREKKGKHGLIAAPCKHNHASHDGGPGWHPDTLLDNDLPVQPGVR